MSNRIIEAVLRLSAKLGSMRAFDQTAAKLDAVNRKALMFNRSQGAMARGAALVSRRLMTGVAGIAVTRGIKESVQSFAAAERRLNRIAINADAGGERMADMFRTVNGAAHDYAMTQDQVTTGLESLVASGRSLDEALSFLPAITATAQAAGADIQDIAVTADAVSASFGIAGDKMQHAFDIMVKGGKLGKFELKDMAQYLPSLAPAMAAIGYDGERGLSKLVAALQTIRMRTGDASSAATDMQNILQKMYSADTATKFRKFGIDVRKELATAKSEGRDLLQTFIDLSIKATKGDLSKLPLLFTDSQYLEGMRALIQGQDALAGMEESLRNVDGQTLADLGKVMSDTQSKIDRMATSWEKLKTSFGGAVADPVGGAMDKISGQLDWQDALDRGKKKRGISGALWGYSQEEMNRIAFDGGWRADDRARLAETGKRALSPERGGGSGWTGTAPVIPIPGNKPKPGDAHIADYTSYGIASTAMRNEVVRTADRDTLGRVTSGGPYAGLNSMIDKAMAASDGVASDIRQGGQDAAQTVKSGLADGGGAAAEAMASAIRSAGADVAAQIAATLRGISVSVDNVPRTKGGESDVRPMPRANVGRSTAGRMGGRV